MARAELCLGCDFHRNPHSMDIAIIIDCQAGSKPFQNLTPIQVSLISNLVKCDEAKVYLRRRSWCRWRWDCDLYGAMVALGYLCSSVGFIFNKSDALVSHVMMHSAMKWFHHTVGHSRLSDELLLPCRPSQADADSLIEPSKQSHFGLEWLAKVKSCSWFAMNQRWCSLGSTRGGLALRCFYNF